MAIEVSSKNNVNPKITISDRNIDTTSTSLNLPGNLYRNWGIVVNNNLFWLLENFAGSASPSAPVIGQFWYDTNEKRMKFFTGTEWKPTSSIKIEDSVPASGNVGDLVYVSSLTEQALYLHDGSNWKSTFRYVENNVPPPSPTGGTIWFDSTTNELKMYSNGSFQTISTIIGGTGPTVENHTTLDGKDVYVIKIGPNILAIFSNDTVTSSNLDIFDGVALNSVFPNGIEPGLNLSNKSKNLNFDSATEVKIENRNTGKISFVSNNSKIFEIDKSTDSMNVFSKFTVSGKTVLNNSLDINTTSYIRIPVGNNAQRPTPPNIGMMRFNTDTGRVEFFDGTFWVELRTITDSINVDVSPEFSIPVNSNVTYTIPGLSSSPKLFFAFAICKIPAGGYFVGDEILLAHQTDFDESSGPNRDFFATWSQGNILGFSARGPVRAPLKSGTGFFILSSPNFNLIFKWIK